MKSKFIKYLTVLFLIVNAICGASFLWGFTGEMIVQWHMKYYRDNNYPLARTETIIIEQKSGKTLKPVFRHYT